MTELPAGRAEAGLGVTLATWEYGSLAEILRLGPCSAEEPTVARLRWWER